MQVPVQIDFIGCDPAPNLRATVEEKLQALESRFGRITAGRVAIRGPSGHHRTGGLYEVAIHLTLPGGRSVNVERVPTPDERFGDPAF
ncbi:MAG: HPF/RaiA family ribosome-associated protein, partial [Sphingomonadales bacterium]